MPERFWGKHRSVTLNHAYHTKGDNTKPTERYPMPNKKDLPHDIIEHLEEAEATVKEISWKKSVHRSLYLSTFNISAVPIHLIRV